jgi:PAS domain S-box-containing protein
VTISVLVVDDEPALLDIVRIFLEREGDISVECASSGLEALQKINKSEFDVIVCDYMMPGLDGIGLLKTIKRLGIETPLIIFTGNGREEIVIDALNYGAYSYLQKGEDPAIQFSQLKELIMRAVQRRKAEKDLIENLQHYRRIVEDHTDLVYRFTLDGTITFVNGPFSHHVSKKPDEIIGKSVFDLVHEDDRKKVQNMMIALNGSMQSSTIDIRVPAADGRVKWQRSTIHAIFAEDGRKIEFQVMGRDITDAKQAEDVMKESEERLRMLFNPSTDFIRVLNKVRQERPGE